MHSISVTHSITCVQTCAHLYLTQSIARPQHPCQQSLATFARIQLNVSCICMFRECVVPLVPPPFVVCLLAHDDTSGRSPGCQSEQEAARILGHTQDTWNDWASAGDQPASVSKSWSELTAKEKGALVILGYTKETWDGRLPASSYKVFWQE